METLKSECFNGLSPKIARDLSLAGFLNITDLLSHHRFKSYTFISDLLSDSFPMIIIYMQFIEAKRGGQVIPALKDSLSRYLIEKLPNGCGVGDNSKWQLIRALTNWSTAVETAGELPELSEILAKISHDLIQNPPPHGWSPEAHSGNIIDTVFDKYISEKSIEGIVKQPKGL